MGFKDFRNLIFVSLLFLFLLTLRWNSFNMPYERDEGEYAYSAWILRQSFFPYQNSFLQKPPMIIYTYYLGQLINDNSLWPPRALAFVSIFLTALAIFVVVRKHYGEKLGWASAFLVSLTLSFPHFTALSANTEIFMILFLVLSFGLCFYYQSKASFFVWLLSGITSSLSIFYKPIAVFPLLFLYCFWIYQSFKNGVNLKDLSIKIFGLVTGFLLMSFVILLPFLISGGINYFFDSVWQFNLYYARVWQSYGLSGFYLQIGKLIRVWWVLLIPFLVFIFSKDKNKNLILGLVIFSLFSSFRTTIGHYYLVIMPFLSIASIIGLWNLYVIFSKKIKIGFSIVFLSFLFLLIYPLRTQFILTSEQLSLWIYGLENPFNESKLVAEKVDENSLPQDYIFVVGSEPQVYFYAKRRSPTRFVITYPLNIYSPKREEYQKEVIRDLGAKIPRLIVYSNKQASGVWEEGSPKFFVDYISKIVSENYFLIGAVEMGRNGPFWINMPKEDEINQASLLLYKLKNE